jgi:hypothetical protein
MKEQRNALLLKILGLCVCIIPPAIATIDLFPLVVDSGEKQISAFGALLLIVCAVPFWKQVKSFLSSPSAWKVWTVVLVLSAVCRAVMDELFVISTIGAISGIVGAFIFALEKSYRKKHGLPKKE